MEDYNRKFWNPFIETLPQESTRSIQLKNFRNLIRYAKKIRFVSREIKRHHIGGTEPCAWAGMCERREGLHIMEPHFLVEILDLETRSKEVEPGELGVAVVTPLGRRSFPMIRFNTKDIVRKGEAGCDCGRTSMMIQEVAGRADDLRKIRGVLFTPVAVEELLRAEFAQIGEYEIIVERQGVMDTISLKFETCQALGEDAMKTLMAQLADRLKVKTNLRFNLLPAKEGELARYTLKAKRFKDLR